MKTKDQLPKNRLVTTLQLLSDRYQAINLTMEELAEVLRITTKSLLNAISAGRFPIQTFKFGGRRLARIQDVADYLDSIPTS